jgi:hypothetical protein
MALMAANLRGEVRERARTARADWRAAMPTMPRPMNGCVTRYRVAAGERRGLRGGKVRTTQMW